MPQAEAGKRMTISEHLEELRSRLIWSAVAVSAGFVLAFWRIDDVMAFMRRPLAPLEAELQNVKIIQTEAYGAFLASMKLAFFAGLILASPIILHNLWGFVAAGLYKHERRVVKYYAIPGFLLFFAGAGLAYFFVMPWAMRFLIGWAVDMGMDSFLTLGNYVSLIAWAMFVFGLMFQLPLIMVFLMRIGVVRPATFRRFRRHAVVVNFLVAMMLTPPDVVSQIALAGCMTILYEAAIVIGSRLSAAEAS